MLQTLYLFQFANTALLLSVQTNEAGTAADAVAVSVCKYSPAADFADNRGCLQESELRNGDIALLHEIAACVTRFAVSARVCIVREAAAQIHWSTDFYCTWVSA